MTCELADIDQGISSLERRRWSRDVAVVVTWRFAGLDEAIFQVKGRPGLYLVCFSYFHSYPFACSRRSGSFLGVSEEYQETRAMRFGAEDKRRSRFDEIQIPTGLTDRLVQRRICGMWIAASGVPCAPRTRPDENRRECCEVPRLEATGGQDGNPTAV